MPTQQSPLPSFAADPVGRALLEPSVYRATENGEMSSIVDSPSASASEIALPTAGGCCIPCQENPLANAGCGHSGPEPDHGCGQWTSHKGAGSGWPRFLTGSRAAARTRLDSAASARVPQRFALYVEERSRGVLGPAVAETLRSIRSLNAIQRATARVIPDIHPDLRVLSATGRSRRTPLRWASRCPPPSPERSSGRPAYWKAFTQISPRILPRGVG